MSDSESTTVNAGTSEGEATGVAAEPRNPMWLFVFTGFTIFANLLQILLLISPTFDTSVYDAWMIPATIGVAIASILCLIGVFMRRKVAIFAYSAISFGFIAVLLAAGSFNARNLMLPTIMTVFAALNIDQFK